MSNNIFKTIISVYAMSIAVMICISTGCNTKQVNGNPRGMYVDGSPIAQFNTTVTAAEGTNTNSVVILSQMNASIAAATIVHRFRADIGSTNIAITNLTLMTYSNVNFITGGIYSNQANMCAWYPMATNGLVKFSGGINTTGAVGSCMLSIYKNAQFMANALSTPSSSGSEMTWSYVSPTQPTITDYYQVYETNSVSKLTSTAGTNNWWFGEVVQ